MNNSKHSVCQGMPNLTKAILKGLQSSVRSCGHVDILMVTRGPYSKVHKQLEFARIVWILVGSYAFLIVFWLAQH